MAALTGLTVGTPDYSYKGLLHFSSNGVITGSLLDIQDGMGTNTGLKLSTTNAEYTGIFAFASKTASTLIYLNASKEVTSLANSAGVLTNDGSGGLSWGAGGGGITIGTTAITSGTAGRILFESATNKVSQSSSLFWDITNSCLGIGTSSLSATDSISIIGSNSNRKSIIMQNTHASGNTSFYFQNDRGSFNAYGGLLTGGSAYNTADFFGVDSADRTTLLSDGANSTGLAVGTLTAMPLIFGTNNLARVYITSAGLAGIGTGATVSARLHVISTTEQLRIGYDTSNYTSFTVGAGGLLTIAPIGAGAGLLLGSATTVKIGLWNTTPVVQPTTAGASATVAHIGGSAMLENDTIDGYTLAQIVKALRNIGILA